MFHVAYETGTEIPSVKYRTKDITKLEKWVIQEDEYVNVYTYHKDPTMYDVDSIDNFRMWKHPITGLICYG